MNLTPIPQKRSLSDISRMLTDYRDKAVKSFNPSVKQCQDIAYRVYLNRLHRTMPEGVKKIFKDYAALMVHTQPKWEAVKRYTSQIRVTERDFEQEYTPKVWQGFSKTLQRRHMLGAELDERDRKATFGEVDRVFAAQGIISDDLPDELYLEFEEIGESTANFALDKVETHILPDFDKDPANLMKPGEIVKYLIARSRGTIVDYDRLNIGKELEERGYTPELNAKGERVGWYVRLV